LWRWPSMPVLCHSDRIQLAGCLDKGLLSGGRLLSSPEAGCALGSEQILIHSELITLLRCSARAPAARGPAHEGAVRWHRRALELPLSF
jgi:hypothetical protein